MTRQYDVDFAFATSCGSLWHVRDERVVLSQALAVILNRTTSARTGMGAFMRSLLTKPQEKHKPTRLVLTTLLVAGEQTSGRVLAQ